MSYIFEDILAEYWWLLTHDQAAAKDCHIQAKTMK